MPEELHGYCVFRKPTEAQAEIRKRNKEFQRTAKWIAPRWDQDPLNAPCFTT